MVRTVALVVITALSARLHSGARPVPPVSHDPSVTQALEFAGVDGISLATSGVTTLELGALLRSLQNRAEPGVVEQAVTSVDAQIRVIGALVEQAAREPENREISSTLESARAELAVRQAQLRSAVNDLLSVVRQGLPEAKGTRLASSIAARQRRVPAEFRANVREDAQWREIERALVLERRAGRDQGQLDPEAARVLDAVRAEPEVALAVQALGRLNELETLLR